MSVAKEMRRRQGKASERFRMYSRRLPRGRYSLMIKMRDRGVLDAVEASVGSTGGAGALRKQGESAPPMSGRVAAAPTDRARDTGRYSGVASAA